MRTTRRVTVALVVAVLAVVLLAGCGTSEPEAGPADQGTTGEPTEETTDETKEPSPSETVPPGPIEYTAIALVSGSNVDGTVSPRAVVLDNRKAVQEFAGRFSGARMGTALSREYARADLPKREVMLGAVVDISCQPPRDIEVEKTDRGIEITAPTKPSKMQCLVPVTTVALVSVPKAAL